MGLASPSRSLVVGKAGLPPLVGCMTFDQVSSLLQFIIALFLFRNRIRAHRQTADVKLGALIARITPKESTE